jgi:hypothetical protein
MTGSGGTPKTHAELFALICSAYDRQPDDARFEPWRRAVDGVPVADLREGFLRHQRDTRPDWDGRPIGRRFPTAADLLMNAKDAKQQARDRRGGWAFCGHPECEGGFVRGEGPGGRVGMIRCPRCAALRTVEGAQRRAG